jgi:PEP-CTERM motif-containing protein
LLRLAPFPKLGLRKVYVKKHALWVLFTAVFASLPVLRGDTVSITLTGVNGASQGNVYVGPYFGQVDTGPTVNLYCDDYIHDSNIGQTWTATVSTFADLSHTLHPGALGDYRRVAWLIEQFGNNPTSSWGDIHYALWSVFNPAPLSPLDSVAQQFFDDSKQHSNDSSLDGEFVIYTPVNAGESQEFLSPAPTPEPGSIVLLGTAVAGVFLLFRKKLSS